MQITFHKNTRTTPAIRQEIQQSPLSARRLVRKYGIQKATVLKWKHRQHIADVSSCPHKLKKTLSDFEELLSVKLRKTLLIS